MNAFENKKSRFTIVNVSNSDKMTSEPVGIKAPRMTQGGLQRIQLQNRPEISETQHTLSHDDDIDSVRRGPIR